MLDILLHHHKPIYAILKENMIEVLEKLLQKDWFINKIPNTYYERDG